MSRAGTVEVSRREQSKAARRDAILEAARSLIRELGTQVPAERIAQRAGVSTATVYNLIGPREQLLGLLLSAFFESLRDQILSMDRADPFLVGDAVVVVSARMFVADASLWLNVIPEVRGAFAQSVAPYITFQPIDLQREAMHRAKALGMLARMADPEMTASQIYAAYNGALFLWAGGFFDDAAFIDHAKAGYWAILAALASGEHRRRAVAELTALHGMRSRGLPPSTDEARAGQRMPTAFRLQ